MRRQRERERRRKHVAGLMVRDLFLGSNYWAQDLAEAVRLSPHAVEHEDARLISVVFKDGPPATPELAKARLLTRGEDARALALAALVAGEDRELMRRAAELGSGLALAWLAFWVGGEERYRYAALAAAAGERGGHFLLGVCLAHGIGVAADVEKGLRHYHLAAEMSFVEAQYWYGVRGCADGGPQRYRYWGRAALRGHEEAISDIHSVLEHETEAYERTGDGRCLFEMGEALWRAGGYADPGGGTVFGRAADSARLALAAWVVALYEEWRKAAIRAAETWLMVGERNGVVRDMRLHIARALWDERCEWSRAPQNYTGRLRKRR